MFEVRPLIYDSYSVASVTATTNTPACMRWFTVTLLAFLLTVSLPSRAADLGGDYSGVARAAGGALHIEQLGTRVSGSLVMPSWQLSFDGVNDGSNMANVGVVVEVSDEEHHGFMILRRHAKSMHVSLIVRTLRELGGQYEFELTEK